MSKVIKKSQVNVKMVSREQWNDTYDYIKSKIQKHSKANVKHGFGPLELTGMTIHYGNDFEVHRMMWKNDGVTDLPCLCNPNPEIDITEATAKLINSVEEK